MKLFRLILAIAAILAAGLAVNLAAAITTIGGTLQNADRTMQSGSVNVSWQTSIAVDGTVIGASQKRFDLVSCVLTVMLEPGQYSVHYVAGTGRVENWQVPVSSSTITLASVINYRYRAGAEPDDIAHPDHDGWSGCRPGYVFRWCPLVARVMRRR